MKWLTKWVWCTVLALVTSSALAQAPERQARQPFSQAELDQMLAPIALYPDSLLSQILMAATYPRDVAEAASWSRSKTGMRGEDAVRAAQNEPWDPSVISLTAFPQVLSMMGQRRYWVERLGEAYVEQPEQVMDTIQALRARADGNGTLRGSEEIIVQRQGDDYIIEPPNPEVVHVPYYDPRVAYGRWWWPDYQPVYWNPWPGYAFYPGYSGFGWGHGITIGSGFFFGALDWPRRYVRYSNHRPWYFRHGDWRHGQRWTHNRDHRRGDRDGRWRDANRDRTRDANRDRTRDGDRTRWRDGDRTRDGQRRAPAQQYDRTAVPNATVGPAAPRYRNDAVSGERVQQPQRASREQPANGMVRPAEARTFGAPRAPAIQHSAPAVQQRAAPVVREAAPAAQPSGNAMSRSREERAAPAEKESSSTPSAPSNAQSRGGRRGSER